MLKVERLCRNFERKTLGETSKVFRLLLQHYST